MKKAICVLLSMVLCFSLCACDFLRDVADSAIHTEAKPKTFDFDGISIGLTTDFLQMGFVSEDYDFIVGNDTLSVMGMKVPFDDSNLADLSILEFAEYFRELMEEENPTEITLIDGIPMMQYLSDEEEDQKTVAVTYYKANDCFWVVCFVTATEDFKETYDDICQYAKSVKCE